MGFKIKKRVESSKRRAFREHERTRLKAGVDGDPEGIRFTVKSWKVKGLPKKRVLDLQEPDEQWFTVKRQIRAEELWQDTEFGETCGIAGDFDEMRWNGPGKTNG